MGFRNLYLKKAYSSDEDNLLDDFYIPILKNSIEYKRIAGFFSSTSLAVAARGIIELIKNNGQVQMLVSPKLYKRDIEVLQETKENHEKYVEKNMLISLEKIEDQFVADHLFALGWMVANQKLEIRIAILYDENGDLMSYEDIDNKGIFHQKVGILIDHDGDYISFSGSINETASAWVENLEEFKVFRSWNASENDYVQEDIKKFNRYWNNNSRLVKVINIPDAVKKRLLEFSPPDINLVNFQRWYKNHKEKIELFGYQKEAVNLWLKNGKKGIFAMATGTGKTFTALACYKKVTQNMKNWICVIACPQVHLIQQWKKEVKDFGVNYENLLVADSTNHGWKDDLVDYLLKIKLGYKNNILLFTTHSTLSSKDFIEIISTKSEKYKIILIADEVHGLGSSKNRKGLIDRYDIRIGLSATPSRWFDDFGSQVLLNYFGGIIYKFEIEKAINEINPLTGETYLTPYKYIPKFISLTSYELNNYFEITRNIIKKMTCAKNEEEEEQLLEKLLFKRANILKNAENKFGMLQAILTELSQPINFTLVYCNPEQINSVLNILSGFEIIVHQFTEKEGTKPERKYGGISEREFILKEFSETKYQVLVAMKCLDEGVNIPPARTAILMASSTNPREYIQRIGRVIRRFPGKEFAIIYDIIVTPSLAKLSSTLKSLEWQIFEKELLRAEEIATFAMNNAEALQEIETIKNQLRGWKF